MSVSFSSRVFIIANEKGGVGKSTTALALIDWLTLNSQPPTIIQVDRQKRLENSIGKDVLTIDSDPKAARLAPELETRRFSPMLEKIEVSAGRAPVIIDIGAGEVERFTTWAALVDLEEEFIEWQLSCHLVVPFLAESEAIRQAAWSVNRLRSALPQSMICLVENQRDGKISTLHPNSSAAQAFGEFLTAWRSQSIQLTLPAIPGNSWRWFETTNCRFLNVVDMTTADTINRTGLSRADAKIVRGDVSQWLVNIFDEFDRAFGVEKG